MKSKILTIFIALIFIVSPFCVLKMTFADNAGEVETIKSDEIAYSAYDLLRIYSQDDISEKEREFLDQTGIEVCFKGVEDAEISAEVDSDNTLTVVALPFETDGLKYEPFCAYVGDKRSLKSEGNKFIIENVEDESAVTVGYRATATVPKQTMNEIVNAAYDKATEYKDKFDALTAEYEHNLEEYNKQNEAYNNYLAAKERYEEEYKKYQAELKTYNAEFAIWKEKNDAYNEYLGELERYRQEKKEYENYLKAQQEYQAQLEKYSKYVIEKESYDKKYAEYEKAVSSPDIQKVLYQLSILEYITKPVSELDRSLEGAINGNAVDMVLSNDDALAKYGPPGTAKAIEIAKNATYALRDLFAQLLKLKTDEAKYQFYISSHDKLSENFNELLRTLDFLYTIQNVQNEMKRRDKVRQYEILLAQLYYICTALDDKLIFNYEFEYGDYTKGTFFSDTYAFSSGKKPSDILDKADRLEDKVWGAPLTGGYPDIPKKPVAPQVVENPGAGPEAKTDPIEPKEVSSPGKKPTEPKLTTEKPVEVEQPIYPIEPVMDEAEAELVKALSSGELKKREPLSEDMKFEIESEKVIYFRQTFVELVFLDADGEEICTVQAERGKAVDNPPSPPIKTKEGYTCTFDGWVTADGEPINLNRLVTNEKFQLYLYPHYLEEINSYLITFIVDGTEIIKSFEFGSIPAYDESDGELVKRGDRPYRFIGWEANGSILDELPPVKENATYVAQFEQSLVATFNVEGEITTAYVWSGEVAHFNGDTPEKVCDNTYAYVFMGWDKPFLPLFEDTIYQALFEKVPLISLNGKPISIKANAADYEVVLSSLSGAKIEFYELMKTAMENNMPVKFAFEGLLNKERHTLEFPISVIKNIVDEGVKAMRFEVYSSKQTLYVSLVMSDGESEVDVDVSIKASICGNFEKNNTYMYEMYDSNRTKTRFSFGEGGEIIFSLRAGCKYEIRAEYEITVLKSDFVSVSVDCVRAGFDDTVIVEVGEVPLGMYVSELYFIKTDGEKITFSGNSFSMPASSIAIGVTCEYYYYTIVFKSEDKVLSTRKLRYGETIVPPEAPTKPSDDKFSYTFTGWDKEITAVTGDAEYNAVYSKADLVHASIQDSRIDKLVKIMDAFFWFLVVCAAAGIVVWVLLKRKGLFVSFGEPVWSTAQGKTEAQGEEPNKTAEAVPVPPPSKRALKKEKAKSQVKPLETKTEPPKTQKKPVGGSYRVVKGSKGSAIKVKKIDGTKKKK